MIDDKTKALFFGLYERFLKQHGAFKERVGGKHGSLYAKAMIQALVGNFPSAFELIDRGKVVPRVFFEIVEAFRFSFILNGTWPEIKDLDDVFLLLRYGYFEAARIRANLWPKDQRWPYHLAIYKVTRDPRDLNLARKSVSQYYNFEKEAVAGRLLDLAQTSGNREDLCRASRFFEKQREHMKANDVFLFLIRRYQIDQQKADIVEARKIIRKIGELEKVYNAWQLLCGVTKDERDLVQFRRSESRLAKFRSRSINRIERLVELSYDHDYGPKMLLIAGKKLLAQPVKETDVKDIKSVMLAMLRTSVPRRYRR